MTDTLNPHKPEGPPPNKNNHEILIAHFWGIEVRKNCQVAYVTMFIQEICKWQ